MSDPLTPAVSATLAAVTSTGAAAYVAATQPGSVPISVMIAAFPIIFTVLTFLWQFSAKQQKVADNIEGLHATVQRLEKDLREIRVAFLSGRKNDEGAD